jgi:cytochrome b6-f complex iron-sulfur subunit
MKKEYTEDFHGIAIVERGKSTEPGLALSSFGRNDYIPTEFTVRCTTPVRSRRCGRACSAANQPLFPHMNAHQNDNDTNERISRRDALARLASGSVLLAGFAALAAFFGIPIPSRLRERTLIRLGKPDRFPFNTFTFVPEKNIFVYRSREGFKALSALCPHLGCVITSTSEGFRCPCHGSTFDPRGAAIKGPAPGPLSWLKVALAADGQIAVDTSERVSGEEVLRV